MLSESTNWLTFFSFSYFIELAFLSAFTVYPLFIFVASVHANFSFRVPFQFLTRTPLLAISILEILIFFTDRLAFISNSSFTFLALFPALAAYSLIAFSTRSALLSFRVPFSVSCAVVFFASVALSVVLVASVAFGHASLSVFIPDETILTLVLLFAFIVPAPALCSFFVQLKFFRTDSFIILEGTLSAVIWTALTAVHHLDRRNVLSPLSHFHVFQECLFLLVVSNSKLASQALGEAVLEVWPLYKIKMLVTFLALIRC